jgi:hypothetical protein
MAILETPWSKFVKRTLLAQLKKAHIGYKRRVFSQGDALKSGYLTKVKTYSGISISYQYGE